MLCVCVCVYNILSLMANSCYNYLIIYFKFKKDMMAYAHIITDLLIIDDFYKNVDK
jgi:hypothetical protein